MHTKIKLVVVLGVIGLVAIAVNAYVNAGGGCGSGICSVFSPPTADAVTSENSDLPTGTEQITFVELGSVNCIPCKKMKPIMDAIESEYAGKVKVVFHDVWKPEGREYGDLYNIRLIPTQVFIDREGNEIARHEGYFPKDEIVALLAEHGVTK